MSDPGIPRVRQGDLPVRDLQASIASLDDHPRAGRATREQKIATAYVAAIARVLGEQSELYVELLAHLNEPASVPPLREEALDSARISAELFLSARREGVDLSAHAFPGQDPLGALLALDVIRSCTTLLAGERPDGGLLLSAAEVDALVHNPSMDAWWDNVLPAGEHPPPRRNGRAASDPPPATGRAVAEDTVILIADCLESSARDYHALLSDDARTVDEAVLREGALRRAIAITELLHGNLMLNVDFDVLDEPLQPTAACAVLHAIANSCIVFAAPDGDFEAYAMTAKELEQALDEPDLADWLQAVDELA